MGNPSPWSQLGHPIHVGLSDRGADFWVLCTLDGKGRLGQDGASTVQVSLRRDASCPQPLPSPRNKGILLHHLARTVALCRLNVGTELLSTV